MTISWLTCKKRGLFLLLTFEFNMKRTIPILVFLLSAISLFAQDSVPVEESADTLSLLGLIRQGGWAMYPLGACSMIMFFLIFYSWKETAAKKFYSREQVNISLQALQVGETQKGVRFLETSDALLNRAIIPALKKIHTGPEKREALFVENLEAEENNVAQWITYLNVVASVAPMIGLLGTVSGMISAFQTIGRGGMGRPELLAGDIGEALITTATGLVIGIPAMIAYFVLRNRLNAAMIATAQAGTELIEAMTVNVERPTSNRDQ